MIPQITEVNFPSYATMHQASASFQEMGERTITTQVRIDGDIVPDFSGWELSFKGERFILPVKEPQAAKDNSTRNSLVDLTFNSWVVEQLKRYLFFETTSVGVGTYIANKYDGSVILPIEGFVDLFNRVLYYYFGNEIQMDLYLKGTGIYSTTPVAVSLNNTYIWDVLTKFYELFELRWYITYDTTLQRYLIKVNYAAPAVDDHDFEYGYEGGLLKFERQVQDYNIKNVLLGRGSEKNLPYRYFKKVDPNNPNWTADPDAIPELANVYFDRLRDVNFRWYVRGWMQNSHRDTSWEEQGYVYPTYTIEEESPYYWAYLRGRTDEKFDPVEYVKDDESITKYGEKWGVLDNNDDVFPTIQDVERSGLGRIDEVVAVSEVTTDDIEAAASAAATEFEVAGVNRTEIISSSLISYSFDIRGVNFTVPEGHTANFDKSGGWLGKVAYARHDDGNWEPVSDDDSLQNLAWINTSSSRIRVYNASTGQEVSQVGLLPGTYYYELHVEITMPEFSSDTESFKFVFGTNGMLLTYTDVQGEKWKPTFDIWVKNIWNSTKDPNETDAQYAARVWGPILGDRVGNEAKVIFSDGFLSVSEDYEFTIVSYPVLDRTKTLNNVTSEWKITLYKSDAEFDATGLYIPNATTGGNAQAGDHFFFTGIDMPFAYVVWAEERLNGAGFSPAINKTASLSEVADLNPTWVISLDKVRVHTIEDEDYGTALADRLSAGATIRIKDRRFTNNSVLTLYVQSITYTWNEPSEGSPYLVPDIEVVLSDKIVSAEGPITQLQGSVDVIRSTYAKVSDVESVIRRVATPLFLKKTGESDTSESPTSFGSKVSSKDFRQGDVGGEGWGLYKNDKGETVLEADTLVARKELRVNTLISNQIAYIGGKQIISAASIGCTRVVEDSNSYICYFDQKQGSIENMFIAGDFAMGQNFSASNVEERYYRMLVTAVGSDSITLSKSVKDGTGVPIAGDTIVQYGNQSNTARQYVIVRDIIGGGYEMMLSGLSAVNSSGKEYYFAGKQTSSLPRWFVGDSVGEYAEWANGQLNIKGRVSVRKSDGAYVAMSNYIESMDYLRVATNEGTTLVDGGLILSNLIALGKTENEQFSIWAGINGIRDITERGNGIAAWFGGDKIDYEDLSAQDRLTARYAKSLFRFDGSGYLASGSIKWDSAGQGSIPGVSWTIEGTTPTVIIGGNVKLASTSGDTLTELLSSVQTLLSYFEKVNIGTQANPVYAIHVKSSMGLYSDSFISAGGLSQGGGGGSLNLDAMWASLKNNPADAHAADVIALAHIPNLTVSKITDFPTSWALSDITGADNLQAIEALTGTSGLLRKTAANTWSLDTNNYIAGAVRNYDLGNTIISEQEARLLKTMPTITDTSYGGTFIYCPSVLYNNPGVLDTLNNTAQFDYVLWIGVCDMVIENDGTINGAAYLAIVEEPQDFRYIAWEI